MEHGFYFSINIGNVIIPIDFHIFQPDSNLPTSTRGASRLADFVPSSSEWGSRRCACPTSAAGLATGDWWRSGMISGKLVQNDWKLTMFYGKTMENHCVSWDQLWKSTVFHGKNYGKIHHTSIAGKSTISTGPWLQVRKVQQSLPEGKLGGFRNNISLG